MFNGDIDEDGNKQPKELSAKRFELCSLLRGANRWECIRASYRIDLLGTEKGMPPLTSSSPPFALSPSSYAGPP